MALHAQRQSPIVCCSVKDEEHSTFRNDDAIQWLLDAQKSDGSVGSSVTFTSLSILGNFKLIKSKLAFLPAS